MIAAAQRWAQHDDLVSERKDRHLSGDEINQDLKNREP